MLSNVYVGFDRDGTLATPDIPIPARLVEQLALLEERGATLFVASGKSHLQLTEIFLPIGFEPWLICAENGGHIVMRGQAQEWVEGCDHVDLQFFRASLPHIQHLPPYDEEPKRSIWSKKFHTRAEEAGRVLRAFIEEHELALDVFVYPDGWGGVDVVPRGIDKVKVLTHIPSPAVVHYFGDGDNDLTLMRDPRVIPHTMSNGNEKVKACVRQKEGLISDFPAGLGVSDILQRLFKL